MLTTQQPFKPIHVIQAPPVEPPTTRESEPAQVLSQNGSTVSFRTQQRQLVEQFMDYQSIGSLSDGEASGPTFTGMPGFGKRKVKMLKTSLYEIREEGGAGYHSNNG
jgi:hypothetical protein